MFQRLKNSNYGQNLLVKVGGSFILPSSMLVRLIDIYMFRCNKILFGTSFVDWLIRHILLNGWIGISLDTAK